MKNYNYIAVLLTTFFVISSLTACNDEMDGRWTPMQWESNVDIEDAITVPATGGTYTVVCKNYRGFWIAYHLQAEGKVYNLSEDYRHCKGDWFSVDIESNVLTVTISPNDSGKRRVLPVGVTAGDIFDGFTFVQNDR